MAISRFIVALTLAANIPFGDQVRAADQMVDVGWHDNLRFDRGWQPEPWLVANPDPNSTKSFGTEGASFRLSTPGKAMAWTLTVNPIWVTEFPMLEMRYDIDGVTTEPTYRVLLLSDDSTGPITPGALNPENPLASGAKTAVASGDRGRHDLRIDLAEYYRSDRIARLTLLLEGGSTPAKIRVHLLRFVARDETEQATPPTRLLGNLEHLGQTTASWSALELPPGPTVSADELARAYDAQADWPSTPYMQRGVTLELRDQQRAALATDIMETASIRVPVHGRGSELAFLMGVRAYGTGKPWGGPTKLRMREPLTSPYEVSVEVVYSDGTRRMHFPWSMSTQLYALARKPDVYVVPLDEEKEVEAFTISDNMGYGQLFLMAASINRSARLYPIGGGKASFALPMERASKPLDRPKLVRDGNTIRAENRLVRLGAALDSGITVDHLQLKPFGRKLTTQPIAIVQVHDTKGTPADLRLSKLYGAEQSTSVLVQAEWQVSGTEPGQYLSCELMVADDDSIRLTPTLHNTTKHVWELEMNYPNLPGIQVSADAGDAYYMLGTRSTALGNQDIRSDERYSGRYPLQLMDVFAKTGGGGLGLIVQDTNLREKHFQFRQQAGVANINVRYPHILVGPESHLRLPTAVLLPHMSDWHDTFEAYRSWARAAFLVGRDSYRLADVFFCRRDYPLGGTDYLYSRPQKRYTPERLIRDSLEGFGAIDMIDISGWAYNESTGRVGNYLLNDLGGIPELANAVRSTHEQSLKLGLYFEGYLLDRRAPLAQRALPAWQIISEDKKPKWWAGEMEFFVCPGVAEWREALSDMIVEVATQTKADAVYTDQYGFSSAALACWSPDHGHPVPSNPPFEERKMFETIRKKLDERSLNTALYCEQMTCDGLVKYIDGAFNYGMSAAQASQHPSKVQLLRFVFPQVALIEMISQGIRPVPVAVDDLHRCFFHGLAFWLKGRSQSWYSPQFQQFAQRIGPILEQHGDVFRSPDCTPLVPTMRDGLYANRFAAKDRIILTLYNGQHEDIHGDLVRTTVPAGWEVTNLLEAKPAELRPDGDDTVIRGTVQPYSAVAYLIAKTKL